MVVDVLGCLIRAGDGDGMTGGRRGWGGALEHVSVFVCEGQGG